MNIKSLTVEDNPNKNVLTSTDLVVLAKLVSIIVNRPEILDVEEITWDEYQELISRLKSIDSKFS